MKSKKYSSFSEAIGIYFIFGIAFFSLILLVAPSLIVLIISFDTRAYLSFPPEGFTLSWYAKVFEKSELVEGFINSMQVGFTVTVVCILLGVPTALACARGRSSKFACLFFPKSANNYTSTFDACYTRRSSIYVRRRF